MRSSCFPDTACRSLDRDRIRQALSETAEYLESLVDQTLALMNGGARLATRWPPSTVPSHLAERPYLQPVLRRTRVHREEHLAPLWRMVGRQSGQPSPRARTGPRPRTGRPGGRSRPNSARERKRSSKTALMRGFDWRVTWPRWPGSRRRRTRGFRTFAGASFTRWRHARPPPCRAGSSVGPNARRRATSDSSSRSHDS